MLYFILHLLSRRCTAASTSASCANTPRIRVCQTLAGSLLWRLVVLALVGTPWSAGAVEPNQCIEPGNNSRGELELRNICTQKVSLSWCVDNPQSSFSCMPRRIASATLASDSATLAAYYKSESAGRQVHWAACIHPKVVAGWRGPGSQFDCR